MKNQWKQVTNRWKSMNNHWKINEDEMKKWVKANIQASLLTLHPVLWSEADYSIVILTFLDQATK